MREMVQTGYMKSICGMTDAVVQRIFVPVLFLLMNTAAIAGIQHSDTLALIGTKPVTSSQFIKLYGEKLNQTGLHDNGESRMKYLLNLVSDELLIQKARQQGMDRTPEARKELARIELQELLNAYSLKHISPIITLTDEGLHSLFRRLNTKIKVSHLYAPDKKVADKLYKKLMKGASFEQLARETFSDPLLRSSGGSLGYISADEMDPEFEKAAFAMKPGEISRPVKTVEGYSIIKVEDIKANPLLTENEFLKAKERLKAFARKRAYEDAVKSFTQNLRKDLGIKFNPAALSWLYSELKGKTIESLSENNLKNNVPAKEKTCIYVRTGNWTLNAVLHELNITSDKQKKWIRSMENLEDFLAGLVMRKHISAAARRENLDKEESFKANTAFAYDSYLLNTIEEKIRSGITISQDSVRSFYDNNPGLFINETEIRLSSILLDDAAAADTVKLLLEKGSSFEALAKKYSVQTLTAAMGGDIGWFKKKMLGGIAEDLFRLKPGEYTGPIKDSDKYAFLKCTEIKPPAVRKFEDCEKEIRSSLLSISWQSHRQNYCDSLKNEIPVHIYKVYLNALKL